MTVDFVESEFMQMQAEEVKLASDLLVRIVRAGTGLGETVMDQELLEKYSSRGREVE